MLAYYGMIGAVQTLYGWRADMRSDKKACCRRAESGKM
jgi:hypothetical protein